MKISSFAINILIFDVFREAARECRRKKKEYIKCLENRVAVLENRNQTLIDELKSLKELYQQKTD